MLFATKSACWASVIALALAFAACSTGTSKGDTGVNRAVSKTQGGFSDAALTPLSDVNLKRAAIPSKLEAIVSPYEPVADRSCVGLTKEIEELSVILGPDYDVYIPPDSTGQKVGDAAGGLALRGVTDAVTGFIPYRSIVRAASGASEHERRLKAAYERGAHRRTYLKGLGAAMGCGWPAAPDPRALPPAKAPAEYRGEAPLVSH